MGRFFMTLGVVLLFVAIGYMVVLMVTAGDGFANDIYNQLLCEDGEWFVERTSYNFNNNASRSSQFYCDSETAEPRDVTLSVVGIVAGGFSVLLIMSLLFMFMGAKRMVMSRTATVMTQLQTYSVSNHAPAQGLTLAERLQQLEDAYNQGLITHAEYQRTRREILASMDD